MESFLFDKKFVKEKPTFLQKFNATNLQINFIINNVHICNFDFLNPTEAFYKDKTLLIFETDCDYVVEKLKDFAKLYFYKNEKCYVIFNENIDQKAIYVTQKIEITSENFDIYFLKDKVQFCLLVDKTNF